MPYEVFWDNEEQTVIRQRYIKTTVEDYYQILDLTYKMIDSVSHEVHLISEIISIDINTKGILPVLQYAFKNKHKNQGIAVLINESAYLSTLLNMSQRLFPNRVTIFQADNIETAHKLIESRMQSQTD
jgi:hypothetical protein